MARYIDADKLLEVLNEELMYVGVMHTEEHEEYLKKGLRVAINDIKRLPTADVVPKSEVAEIIEEAFKMMQDNFVNTPIYKVFPHRLKAELKKKYTEGL